MHQARAIITIDAAVIAFGMSADDEAAGFVGHIDGFIFAAYDKVGTTACDNLIARSLDERSQHMLHPGIVFGQAATLGLLGILLIGKVREQPVNVDQLGRLAGDKRHTGNFASLVSWGDVMIEDDPLFLDAANNDLHLDWGSPCINRGKAYGALPGDMEREGPFGEWTGYYASSARPEPVIQVKNVYYRNNPILCCARPGRPPSDYSFSKCVVKSGMIWDELEKAGIPNVKGVWCHEAGGGRMLNIVSIKQSYPGHARQAGLVTSQCHAGAYLGRYVIVVDEDIDPSNTFDVLWAVASRSEPAESIEIIRRCWSGPLDPRIPVVKKGFNSRAIIDACRPYEWKDEFFPVVESSPELRAATLEKWRNIIFS